MPAAGEPVFTESATGRKPSATRREELQHALRLLARGEEKLGGSILYFLAGYAAAAQNTILLLPHTPYGDVWGATAAGAVRAGKDIRVLPIGHLDLLTAVQWRRRRKTKQWYKAPPIVVGELEKNPFRTEVIHAVFNERRPVAVSYDEERGSFSFVEP